MTDSADEESSSEDRREVPEPGRDDPASPGEQTADQAEQDAPVMAKLVVAGTDIESVVDPELQGVIRVGSPFLEDPEVAIATPAAPEVNYAEFGPYVYTAMGASVAAVLVACFAIAGSVWFPAGGTIVALLGGFLSMLGLFSAGRFRWVAFGSLFTHGGLFFLSYVRWLS
ncbi:MAG: hypothetical protein AAF802_16940 [Planctomycetota bacterium]